MGISNVIRTAKGISKMRLCLQAAKGDICSTKEKHRQRFYKS